jgi:hypothetical protein
MQVVYTLYYVFEGHEFELRRILFPSESFPASSFADSPSWSAESGGWQLPLLKLLVEEVIPH